MSKFFEDEDVQRHTQGFLIRCKESRREGKRPQVPLPLELSSYAEVFQEQESNSWSPI